MGDSFTSRSGVPIAYDIYEASGTQRGAVLLCQGLSGDKSLVLPDVAKAFAAAGFSCLAFDYRGYGESGGDRGWVDPVGRLEDAHEAFDFLQRKTGVLPAVYGLSLGGGIAYGLASQRQVASLVVVSGFASGERLMRGLRTAQEYVDFKQRLSEGDEMVPITDIFPFSAKFLAAYQALPRSDAGAHSSSIPAPHLFHLDSARLLLRYEVTGSLSKIAPAPVLVQHGELDNVIPIEDVYEVYRALPAGSKLIVHDGYDHVGLDNGPGFELQVAASLAFLQQTVR